MNFIDTILRDLKYAGKEESDIVWVGNEVVGLPWSTFKVLIGDIRLAGDEWNSTIFIHGNGWWLEPQDDGGIYWWFKTMIERPDEIMQFDDFVTGNYRKRKYEEARRLRHNEKMREKRAALKEDQKKSSLTEP